MLAVTCRKCGVVLARFNTPLPAGVAADCDQCFGERGQKSVGVWHVQPGKTMTWDQAQTGRGIYSDRQVADALARKRADNYERKAGAGKRPRGS